MSDSDVSEVSQANKDDVVICFVSPTIATVAANTLQTLLLLLLPQTWLVLLLTEPRVWLPDTNLSPEFVSRQVRMSVSRASLHAIIPSSDISSDQQTKDQQLVFSNEKKNCTFVSQQFEMFVSCFCCFAELNDKLIVCDTCQQQLIFL